MQIELRKIHYSKALSHETAAFTAEIWVDGKKRGSVENDGHGGANTIHPWSLGQEIEAHAKTLPRITFPGFEGTHEQSADLVIGDLLDDHLITKELKSLLRRKQVFIGDDKVYTLPLGVKSTMTTLNDLPFDEAFRAYKQRVIA